MSAGRPIRIVYFGSGAFGLPTLQHLAASDAFDVRALVTQPDRPAGRGGRTTANPIAAWGEGALEVPVLKPERCSKEPALSEIRGIECDAWVVIAYGQKLSETLLADRFACNLHASLLPRWRGAAPINAAALAGDTVTGNSVITLAERMDAGLVLGQSERAIDPDRTAGELHDELARDGPALMERVLLSQAAGTLEGAAQDETLVTIAPKLGRGDAWVDFRDSAEACRRRVHGLTPWPGIAVEHAGTRLKVLRVGVEEADVDAGPGQIIEPERGIVACGRGALRLVEVQPAGKKPMAWAAYANGRSISRGDRVSSVVAAPEGTA